MDFDLNEYTIFKTLTGSRVYGTFNEQSDYDYRGVIIPPEKYFLSFLAHFEQFESKQEDMVVYDIRKFLKLAASNNPNIIELLYIPEKFWVTSSPYWKEITSIKDLFLSKRCYETFKGYARSQLKKAIQYEKTNSVRSALIDKIGYDCKNGMHLYRLLNSCKEILKEHTILVERPDKDFLLEIRNGNVPYKDLMRLVDELSIELEHLFESTTLPEKPNYKIIEGVGIDIIKRHIFNKG